MLFVDPVGCGLAQGDEHADDLRQQALARMDIVSRQQVLGNEYIKAGSTLERGPVGLPQIDDPLGCRLGAAGVGNVDQNALRSTSQMIACGNTPWQPVEQSATNRCKAQARLVNDQLFMPERFCHSDDLSTLNRLHLTGYP